MNDNAISRRDVLGLLAALGAGAASGEALAQDAVKTDPRGYKVLLDNDQMRVIEHYSRPRLGICGKGMHSHPPHLTVCLTDAEAKVTLQDGKTFMAKNAAGDVFWDPGGTHSVENVGRRDVKVYILEIKKA